jgi:hypothetical protein
MSVCPKDVAFVLLFLFNMVFARQAPCPPLGLRGPTGPGDVPEKVTEVEHWKDQAKCFADLYSKVAQLSNTLREALRRMEKETWLEKLKRQIFSAYIPMNHSIYGKHGFVTQTID